MKSHGDHIGMADFARRQTSKLLMGTPQRAAGADASGAPLVERWNSDGPNMVNVHQELLEKSICPLSIAVDNGIAED